MKKKQCIYISGKIGGTSISTATRKKFAQAEELLKQRGFRAVNPTTVEWVATMERGYGRRVCDNWDFAIDKYDYFLLRDMQVLATCDAIYMLGDWLDSPGAKAEYAFAVATEKQIYYADELYCDGTLRGKSYEKHRLPEVAP